MKRTLREPEKVSVAHYSGAQVPDDVKRFMALVAPGLKCHGVSFDVFRTLASEAGYEVSERTLREHRAAAATGRLPLSTDKHAGRPCALTERQVMVLIGWVLHQNDANETVDLRAAGRFVHHQFRVPMAASTLSSYLHGAGLSSRLMRHRTAGFRLDMEAMLELYARDLERLWQAGVTEERPSQVCMMDSSVLGWRLLQRRTFSPVGGQQPRMKEGNPSHTNLVVWAVFPDGVNRCPALLFTSDPYFKDTPKYRSSLQPHLDAYGMDASRVVYVDQGVYVGESNATVQVFLDRYPALKGRLVVSDAGKAYQRDGTDLVVKWGARHLTFTPAVHQYLSVLDNHCFGIAKRKLRANTVDPGDRIEPSLLFLHALDAIPRTTIRAMWRRNLQLGNKEVDRDAVRKVLSPRGKVQQGFSTYHDYCRDQYRMDVLAQDPIYTDQPPRELQESMIDVYWK